MSNKFQFRDHWYELAPEWLTTGTAERYMYTLQIMSDLLMEKMNQAIHFRMPGQGDVSQLPYLSNDRLLVQGPNESNARFIQRLINAFSTWKKVGSNLSALDQLQIYLQGMQPGVAANLPLMTVIGGNYPTDTTWDQLYQGDSIGAVPTHTRIVPSNFNWDNASKPWRSWLVLYMSLLATGLSGSSGQIGSASAGSLLGRNVNGVWVPGVSGTPVNSPFFAMSGLSGLTAGNVGQWITISGSSHSTNNGTFPITAFGSSSTCTIANPGGVASDTGPLTWSIGKYPFIAPGPVWGFPGYTFGQGQSSIPVIDTGTNFRGIWQPNFPLSGGIPAISWGLSCSANVVQSIRLLLQRWKSGTSYYPNIIVAFDGGTGASGNAYSPNSNVGSGNPDGTFGSVGKTVNGIKVPTRLITSIFDAYCQGTGSWNACSVENVT